MNLEQFVLGHDPISRLGVFTPIALGAVLIEWCHIPNPLRVPREVMPLRLAEFETHDVQGGITAWRAKNWPVAIH